MTLLLESTIKMSVVVAVGLLAVVALRNRSAAMRHWVLAAALVCAAATPILLPVAPAWTLFDPTPSGSRASDRRPSTVAVPSREGATQFEPVTAMEPLVSIGRIPNAATFLAVIWLAGIGVKVAVLLIGLSVLRQHSIRAAEVTGGRWIEIARETAQVFGLRRRIRVLRGDHPTLLATWGMRAPRVLLPASSSDWPEDRIRIVLAHELAHVARRDWAVQIGAELLCSVYWFNPLLWIAASRLRLESEHACDDAVVTLGIGAREYATHLVELARMLGTNGRTWLPAFAIAARPSTLERRVNAMLSTDINRRPVSVASPSSQILRLPCLRRALR
jgi:beta-lactamase regulating signal transducer with metallopeptidase domain